MATPAQLFTENANADVARRQAQQNLERQRQQNTVGAQLLDAINNASNIKPQTKDENGNIIPNPAYADAQKAKQDLITQYMGLNSPEQHANFADRLHGLIFGHPETNPQQPALSPNSSPNTPPPEQGQAAAPPPPAAPAPLHPMAPAPPSHPLHAITTGIKALGNHLQAFANPNPSPPQPDAALIAKYYQDPAQLAAERAAEREQELAETKGKWAVETAKARGVNVRPIHMGDVTPKDAINNMHNFGYVYTQEDGTPYTEADLAEMPDYMRIAEFRQGANTFSKAFDQNSKKWSIGGIEYQAGTLGKQGPETLTPLGQTTSTLPVQATTTETSPGGEQVVKGTSERQRVPTGITEAPTAAAPQSSSPVLKVRAQANPTAATPVAPLTPKDKKISVGTASIGDVAPNIQNMTQANAAKATKAQPAVTALLGNYGDPQLPQVKSMVDFSKLADDAHARKILGEAFKLLNQQMGEVSDPGIIQTLGTAAGWANFRANAEAKAQQDVGSRMTDEEKEYFNTAIAAMADIIGARAATGQSPARFSVQFMENEVPQIGTSSVTDQKSYIQKMLTIARQIKIGLNAMPDNSRAQKWLLKRENDLIQQSNALSTKLNPRSANAPSPPNGSAKGQVSLAKAMALPENKGKSEQDVKADITAKGYTPVK